MMGILKTPMPRMTTSLWMSSKWRVMYTDIVKNLLITISADEIDEEEWLHAAAHNPAFDFLCDPEEDFYTLADGKINFRLSQNSI